MRAEFIQSGPDRRDVIAPWSARAKEITKMNQHDFTPALPASLTAGAASAMPADMDNVLPENALRALGDRISQALREEDGESGSPRKMGDHGKRFGQAAGQEELWTDAAFGPANAAAETDAKDAKDANGARDAKDSAQTQGGVTRRPRPGGLLAAVNSSRAIMLHPWEFQCALAQAGHDPYAVDPETLEDRPKQFIPIEKMLFALRLGVSLGGAAGIAALFAPGAVNLLRVDGEPCATRVVAALKLLGLPNGSKVTEERLHVKGADTLLVLELVDEKTEWKGRAYNSTYEQFFKQLGGPAPIVAIAPKDLVLPAGIQAAFCAERKLAPLSRAILAEGLRHTNSATGRIGAGVIRALPDDDVLAELSPHDITAAFRRPGLFAGVERLREIAAKQGQRADSAKAKGPVLNDFEGYGAAEATAQRMVEDLGAWQRGEISWASVERSVIFYGQPGTGKSHLARAMANSAGVPVITGNFGTWQSAGHLGHMLKAMRDDFKAARKNAPCVFIIDEVDGLGDRAEPGMGRHRAYAQQVINAFLVEMDALKKMEGVLVVGTCNYPSLLDAAAVRPGRFDKLVEVPLPGPHAVRKILAGCIGDALGRDVAPDGAELEGTLDRLAQIGTGLSAAQLDGAVRTARSAARAEKREICEADLEAALREMMGGGLTPASLRRTAIHECGHALVGAALGLAPCSRVMLTADGGETVQSPHAITSDLAGIETWLSVLMAGRAAEQILLGSISAGAGGSANSDLAQASKLACRIDSQLGIGAEGPLWRDLPHSAYLQDKEAAARVRARLEAAEARASEVLAPHAQLLSDMAHALVARRCLEGVELAAWLKKLRLGGGGEKTTLH
ncbi:MAG: AAA family ATPase [Paracoccus sp. (in: a-proteobacteria)]|nr:AAA family ATPase [Paracoccus sp. (in: a-proteobacteria)]